MKYICKVHKLEFDSLLALADHAKEAAIPTFAPKYGKMIPKPICAYGVEHVSRAQLINEIKSLLGLSAKQSERMADELA